MTALVILGFTLAIGALLMWSREVSAHHATRGRHKVELSQAQAIQLPVPYWPTDSLPYVVAHMDDRAVEGKLVRLSRKAGA